MGFVRVQNAVKDENGIIVGGSASILESEYVKGEKHHCRQRMVESLGKAVYVDNEKKVGIFLSKTRGLVQYDWGCDEFSDVPEDDPRIAGMESVPGNVTHLPFGDAYLLSMVMRESGMAESLRAAAGDALYPRMLVRLMHEVLRNGSLTKCDRFLRGSFLSLAVPELDPGSMRDPVKDLEAFGSDKVSSACLNAGGRKPRNDSGCYVDFPMPIGAQTQGRRAVSIMNADGSPSRIGVIDPEDDPQSVMKKMIDGLRKDRSVRTSTLVLGSDYFEEDLIRAFNCGFDSGTGMVVAMPQSKEGVFRDLYKEAKGAFDKPKFSFKAGGRTYYGVKMEVELFDEPEFAYVVLDEKAAYEGYEQFVARKPDKFKKMTSGEKSWIRHRSGCFVLVSNIDDTCEAIVDMCIGRMSSSPDIELPEDLSKDACKGMMLLNIILSSVYSRLESVASKNKTTVPDILDDARTVICFHEEGKRVGVHPAGEEARKVFSMFGIAPPRSVDIDRFRADVLGL